MTSQEEADILLAEHQANRGAKAMTTYSLDGPKDQFCQSTGQPFVDADPALVKPMGEITPMTSDNLADQLVVALRAMPSSLNDACRTMEAAAAFIEGNRSGDIVREMLKAYDEGYLQMSSPEIGEPENDIPYHPWHEELIDNARAVLIAGPAPDKAALPFNHILDPLSYLCGVREGNIDPTMENLRSALAIVLDRIREASDRSR